MSEEQQAPERIWVSEIVALSKHKTDWHAHISDDKIDDGDIEYIRADLAPVVQLPSLQVEEIAKEIVDRFKGGSCTSALLTTSPEEDRLRKDIAEAITRGAELQREISVRTIKDMGSKWKARLPNSDDPSFKYHYQTKSDAADEIAIAIRLSKQPSCAT